MARSDTGSMDVGGVVVAVSSVVVLVAAFLAWLTQSSMFGGSEAITGIDLIQGSPVFNGGATIVLAIVATAVALVAPDDEQANVLVAVLGVLVVLVAAIVLVSPETVFGSGFWDQVAADASSPAAGLFLTILGGIGILGGGFMSYAA